MGNCLRNNKKIAQTKPDEPKPRSRPDVDQSAEGQREGSIEKGEESNVVRIKVLVTRDELKQILGHNKNGGISSVEHLVHFLKHRARKISGVHHDSDGEFTNANWKPTLDAIPEDCYRHLHDYFTRD